MQAVIQESYADHLPEFEVALMTGMRQGEQFRREWKDVDLDAATIRLQISKNGQCRFVHLNARAMAALRMLHAQKHRRWAGVSEQEAALVHEGGARGQGRRLHLARSAPHFR